MHYTSHIGYLTIVSEDAIAKGIRRIVALTGPEARKAIRTAKILQEQLTEFEAAVQNKKKFEMKSKECMRKIVELTKEISHSLIPAYWKAIIFNKTY